MAEDTKSEEGAFDPSLAGPGHPKQPPDAHGHSGERFLPLADKAIADGHVPEPAPPE